MNCSPFAALVQMATSRPQSRPGKGNHEPKIPRVPAPVNKRFGRLVVLSEGARQPNPTATGYYARRWLCKCDCGVTRNVSMANLRSGNTKSCGCLSGASTWYKTKSET